MTRKATSSPVASNLSAVAVLVALGCSSCDRIQYARSQATGVHEEQIQFNSGETALAGTLFLPRSGGPHPAVVLFHGSGPERRNLFTAHWFAEHGMAALTYDKRGVGGSGGDFRAVPFTALCDDGLAAAALLRTRADIDPHRIGVWGLSQGGWLAPLAASRSRDIAFVIAVSGPGVSPGEQMIFYYANELRARGMAERDIQEASALRREIWDYLHSGEGFEQAKAALFRATHAPWYQVVKQQGDHLFGPLQSPADLKTTNPSNRWFQQEMTYDPTQALQKLGVPCLFIFGEDDQVVPVPQSVSAIRATLERSVRQDFTIRVLPHLDHGMRTHASNRSNPAPEYLETMRAWLSARHF